LERYTIEFLHEVDSTNDYLKSKVRSSKLTGQYCVSASVQTSGRGQRENTWFSEPFANVLCSFLLDESEKLKEVPLISYAACLAVVNVLKKNGIENPKIKWPNDVYVRGRKIAGILIENLWSEGKNQKSIIGIGINVNQKSFSEIKATSMMQEMKSSFETVNVLTELYTEIYKSLELPKDAILRDVNSQLLYKGEYVTFEEGDRLNEYIVKQMLENGNLEVQQAQNIFELEHHRVKWKV